MAATPHSIRLRLIETPRLRLHVREMGSGPLMLFLHGITSNSAVFGRLMPALSDRFTTVAVDQRGHGLSDKPSTGYTADDYADDIAALVRQYGLGPAVIVGHSLGARNGVTAAARHSGLVRAVVAIDFTPFIEDAVFDALESRVNAGDQRFADEEAVRAYLQNRYVRIPPDAIAVRAASGYTQSEGGLRPLASPSAMAQTAEGLRADLTQAFRDVKVPVLIVRGALSALVSPAALNKTRELRPDLPVVVVPDADHYVNEEAPERVLEAIESFLGEQSPGDPPRPAGARA